MKVSLKAAKAAYEAQNALFWAWFAIACCEGDAVTAILLLCVKSLIYAAMHGDLKEWEDEHNDER